MGGDGCDSGAVVHAGIEAASTARSCLAEVIQGLGALRGQDA